MRAVLLLLILLVVIAIAAVATGFININQTQPAQAPQIGASSEGVSAEGGQPPKFKVDTGQIAVGSRDAQVKLPSIEVRPAGGAAQQNEQQQDVATTNATQQ